MKTQVVLVQGGGSDGAHDEWDDKLVESLKKISVQTTTSSRMPHEADPKYAPWKSALEKQIAKLDDSA